MQGAVLKLVWTPLLTATLAGLAGCSAPADPAPVRESAAAATRNGGIESHLVLREPPSVLQVPAAEMRRTLHDAYRPRPDKRFLLAVAEVHRFLTGEERRLVETLFRDGRWQLRYRGLEVGSVPEFPDFGDLMKALDGWARAVARDHPPGLEAVPPSLKLRAALARLDRFLAPDAAAAAVALDELWRGGERSPALLAAAARALTLLAFQFLDRAETGDLLPGRALAVVALTRALTDHDTTRLEAMLAAALGYGAHAELLARSLPASDPLGAHLRGDHPIVEVLAARGDAPPETRYLALAGVAERRDPERWRDAVERHFLLERDFLPILETGLDVRRFSTDSELAPALLTRVVVRAMAAAAPPAEGETLDEMLAQLLEQSERELRLLLESDLGSDRAVLARRLETELETLRQRHAGPFLDGATYGAYLRGHFASALSILGLHRLDSLSWVDAAESLSRELTEPPQGVVADLATWYRGLSDAKAGRPDPARLAEQLGSLPGLGAEPLRRTFEELWEVTPYADPLRLVGARRLVARMDTRPRHLARLAPIARTKLLDLPRAERLYDAVLALAPADHPHIRSWRAYLAGDTPVLLEMADSPALELAERSRAVEYLEYLGALAPREVRGRHEALIREHPEDWALRREYVGFLRRREDPGRGIEVVRDWLAHHEGEEGFDYIAARTLLGRLWAERGRYREALDAVLPVVASGVSGTMERAAIILDQAGRTEEAEELFRAAVERYPDLLRTSARYARFLWSHGRHDEAARLLGSWPRPIGVLAWRDELGEPFAEVFAERPDEEVVAAYEALQQAGVGVPALEQLALRIYWAKRPELAFLLVTRLEASGLQQIHLQVVAYRYRSAWRGEAEAEEWLRTRIHPGQLGMASMLFYDRGRYDLLWTLIERPAPPRDESFVWLMRAAAWLREETPGADPQALREYFTRPRADPYHTMGRYLLGQASREEMLALATDARKRCEIAYYLGLEAHAAGRYEEASDWYRVAVETGLETNGEYRWAYNTLHDWVEETKSLERLAAEGL